jgi:hypothetical protein
MPEFLMGFTVTDKLTLALLTVEKAGLVDGMSILDLG